VAAIEIMLNNAAVSNVIREGKTEQLENVIQSGGMQGMQSMDNALRRLLDAKIITGEEAYLKARHKADFEKFLESTAESSVEEIVLDSAQERPGWTNR